MRAQCLGIEIASTQILDIEVTRGGIRRRVYQLTRRDDFLIVVVAVQIVNRRERAVFGRVPKRALSCSDGHAREYTFRRATQSKENAANEGGSVSIGLLPPIAYPYRRSSAPREA